MSDEESYWITVVELGGFTKSVKSVLSRDETEGLVTYLANNPESGAVIPETGGLRKLRWGAKGRGKSGGARVIYYYRDLNMPLYLLVGFGKGERIDISSAEKRAFRQLVEQIVNEHWTKGVTTRLVRVPKSA